MKFVQVILIIIAGFYLLKIIGRIVLPWLLKRLINKMAKQQGQQFGTFFGQANQNYQDYQQNNSTGKVTVEYQKNSSKNKSKEGEYIDFEEVK